MYENEKPSRFSFVVSGKVAKSAVSRNTLRRRGYEAIKELGPKPTGAVGMFFAKSKAADLPYKTLKIEIASLLRESRLL